MSWFEVDRGGLRQLLEGKDKGFILRELIANAIDEPGVTRIEIDIQPVPGKPLVRVIVSDDAPEGFYDLRHAYTLYAKTRKRPDPEKRGRFNLGEKQVLALAKKALIRTTTGQVLFTEDGERHEYRTSIDKEHRTEKGSMVDLTIPATRSEIAEMERVVSTFILPPRVHVLFRDVHVTRPNAVESIDATLTTEYEDEQGQWRRTQRKTTVELYQPKDGHKPALYEMGLPVVELEGGEPWHLNVMQRVPLNTDRDNVSPAFIRDLRAEVLNRMAANLTDDQAAESWVSDGTDDERITSEAVKTIVSKKFGDRAVVADPSDPASRERAIQAGYTIVPARSMSAATWANVRKAEAVPASSKVFGSCCVEAEQVADENITPEMGTVREIAKRIAKAIYGINLEVKFVRSKADSAAQWSNIPSPRLTFNVTRLGKKWFGYRNIDRHVELVVHEIAHREGGHLDASYINALCMIGSELFKLDRHAMLVDINGMA